jgi:hypothetical protein
MAPYDGMMDHRERMLAAMRRKPVDAEAWAPRMDLWYIAQKARGTLPHQFAGMHMAELAEHLGVGCHAVRADFTLERRSGDNALRGLGFDNHPDYPYRVELRDLPMHYERDGDRYTTRIETSKGDVAFCLQQTSEMAAAGISLPFVLSYPVESVDDIDRTAEVFEHLEVVPTPAGYVRFHERVGSSGVAVANGCIAASPIHLLLHELMPMDLFFYAYHDSYHRLAEFSERAAPFFDSALEATLASKAEAVLWGANFDRDLTWPPFFTRDVLPWLNKAADLLHERGKLLLCHTDGENRGLVEYYRQAAFDVAESFCPAPMTSYALRDFRRSLGSDVCVWGGVPSVALLADSFDGDSFDTLLRQLQTELRDTSEELSPVILGVSDNVPPDADLGRLSAIADALRDGD